MQQPKDNWAGPLEIVAVSLSHTRWENLGSSIAMEDILKDPKLCSSVGNLAAIRSFFEVKKDDGQERLWIHQACHTS
jgi:hypothetical protein